MVAMYLHKMSANHSLYTTHQQLPVFHNDIEIIEPSCHIFKQLEQLCQSLQSLWVSQYTSNGQASKWSLHRFLWGEDFLTWQNADHYFISHFSVFFCHLYNANISEMLLIPQKPHHTEKGNIYHTEESIGLLCQSMYSVLVA